MKNSNDTIGNRTRDLPACSAVSQRTAPPRAPAHHVAAVNLLKPNDIYICRTAVLTSRRYIVNIYSTNIRAVYFKHAA